MQQTAEGVVAGLAAGGRSGPLSVGSQPGSGQTAEVVVVPLLAASRLGSGLIQAAEAVVVAGLADRRAIGAMAGQVLAGLGVGQTAEVVVVARTAVMGNRGTGRSRGR